MIQVCLDGGRRFLAAELSPGASAYVDAEWLPFSGEGTAVVVSAEGTVRWGANGISAAFPSQLDQDAAACALFVAVARAAAAAAADVPPEAVEVAGSGAVASLVRELVGVNEAEPRAIVARHEPPQAVVDTTGDPEVIVGATTRLADLGRLVLAGEQLGRPLDLNLYPDVHVRGLQVVGVPAPLAGGDIERVFVDLDGRLLERFRSRLAELRPGGELSPGHLCYAIRA